jgi:TolA-binding protein
MKAALPIVALVAAVIFVLLVTKRGSEGTVDRVKEGAEDALEEIEARIKDLRQRAAKLRGEAKQRLQDQAHDLEARQRELRARLEEIRSEASRLISRNRSE